MPASCLCWSPPLWLLQRSSPCLSLVIRCCTGSSRCVVPAARRPRFMLLIPHVTCLFTPQLPMLNLIRYNVAGGGDSALYGVEGPLFYLRNTFNAFNLALLLALVSPVVRASGASYMFRSGSESHRCTRRRWLRRLRQTGGTSSGSCPSWARCTCGWESCRPYRTRRSASCTSSTHRRVCKGQFCWLAVHSALTAVRPQLCLGAAVTLHAVNEVFESAFVMRRVPWLRFVGYTLVGAVVAGAAGRFCLQVER